jgi:hypothetical protein
MGSFLPAQAGFLHPLPCAFPVLSEPCGTVEHMDELLMRTGTTGWCPDCADERILVAVEDGLDYCCTDCDAAVLLPLLDVEVTAYRLSA